MTLNSQKTWLTNCAGRIILFFYRLCVPLMKKKEYSKHTLLQHTRREIFLVKGQTIPTGREKQNHPIALAHKVVLSFLCMAVGIIVTAQVSRQPGQLTGRGIPASVTHNSSSRSITSLDYSLNAVLWQQRSGEYKALCYQAFSLARLKLQEKIGQHQRDEKPLAIITDIDESILDNSPQQASDILHHRTYTETNWLEWTSKASAGALPGAVAFFQYADKMGIQCFYVSNRRPVERAATIQNLLAAGFPQADTLHVIMKDTSSDKEPRRGDIRSRYNVALLVGDNLNDFDKMFYRQPAFTRCNLVRDNSDLFGDLFIILPNPMYGEWESAIWDGKKITPQDADKLKHEALYEY